MRTGFVATACAVAVVTGGQAIAHHSFAMFDSSKTVTIDGTVREFTWSNPHAILWVVAKAADGATQEWPIELTAPAGLTRDGLSKRSFAPGDHVKVDIHPMRTGALGGSFVGATFPETGKRVAPHRGAPPPAPVAPAAS